MKSELSKTILASVIAGLIVWAITSSFSDRKAKTPPGILA